MDRELIRDYLQQTEMKQPQAEALSRIFAEMATKSDLTQLESRLTWRTIAIVGFFATVTTLLNAFIS